MLVPVIKVVGLIAILALIISAWRLRALPDKASAPVSPLALWLAPALAIILGFLATIPSAPPFAPGMRLGIGYLVGGAAGLAMLCLALMAQAKRIADRPAAGLYLMASGLGLVLLGVTPLYAFLYGYPNDALIGFALGAVLVNVLTRVLGGPERALDWFGLVAVVVAASQFLGVQHFEAAARLNRDCGLLVASAGLVGLLVAAELSGQKWLDRDRPIIPLVSSGIAFILSLLLLHLIPFTMPSLRGSLTVADLTIVTGAISGVLLLWFLYSTTHTGNGAARALGASLLALLLLTLGYKLLAGYGISLALLTILSLAGCVLGLTYAADGDAAAPLHLAARGLLAILQLAAGVLVFRLFLSHLAPRYTLDLEQQFVLIGLLVGLGAALLLAGLRAQRPALTVPATALTLFAALLALLIPSLIYMVWGDKAIAGLLLGLVGSQFFALYLFLTGPVTWPQQSVAPWALLLTLIAAQFMRALAPLGDLPRADKAWLVVGMGGLTIAWLLWDVVFRGARGSG